MNDEDYELALDLQFRASDIAHRTDICDAVTQDNPDGSERQAEGTET